MPRYPDDRDFSYVTTVVGEGGRLEDLERTLSVQQKDEFLHVLTEGFPTSVYWPVKERDNVEFDVLVRRSSRGGADTATFRRSLGVLLTDLLRCGYKISSKGNERVELVAQHDF